MEAIDEVSKQIIASVDHIDILINNAGRSIRRAVHESVDRFHDFLNGPCAAELFRRRASGDEYPATNDDSSCGPYYSTSARLVYWPMPARFSAYVASKAALDAFSRCLSAEVQFSHKIAITSIYMPLVRTPMIAPTKIYRICPNAFSGNRLQT